MLWHDATRLTDRAHGRPRLAAHPMRPAASSLLVVQVRSEAEQLSKGNSEELLRARIDAMDAKLDQLVQMMSSR